MVTRSFGVMEKPATRHRPFTLTGPLSRIRSSIAYNRHTDERFEWPSPIIRAADETAMASTATDTAAETADCGNNAPCRAFSPYANFVMVAL